VLDSSWVIIPATPIAAWILVRGLRRRVGISTLLLQLVALTHLAAVAAVTFFPLPIQPDLIATGRAFQGAHNNVVPLVSLINALATGSTPSVVDRSIGNLLLLMPLGVYLPLLVPWARRLGTTVLVGLGLSVAIEAGQLGISAILGYTYKIADVDDLILNAAGVAIGFGIFWITRRLVRVQRSSAGRLAPSGQSGGTSRGGIAE
jgi:glycopeptide antibiotics resistance protein